jgi:O-succinylbenzoic acid--CoA ligase
MDASLLTNPRFWNDPQPAGCGVVPDLPELAGHVLFETSGSSGIPKSVALSKQALLISAAAVNQHLKVTPASCWGLALPLNHVGGFGVAARAYQADCGFYPFTPRWEPIAFQKWLGDFQITHTSLVPTQVHDLVQAGCRAPGALRAIVVGGGRLDSITGQAARDLGWPVLASYGMTEAGSQIATQGLELLDQPYQAFPIPLLPIWDAQTAADQVLSISGPALFSGYVSGGDFHPRVSSGFLTSDRAALQDRALTPLGRLDTLVKILGELVDPESIERELFAISNGKLSLGTFAVIAVPDERAGCLLVPFFESSVPQALIDTTLAIYQSNAPGFKRLKPAVTVEKMPRSELGKLQRNKMLDVYRTFSSISSS